MADDIQLWSPSNTPFPSFLKPEVSANLPSVPPLQSIDKYVQDFTGSHLPKGFLPTDEWWKNVTKGLPNANTFSLEHWFFRLVTVAVGLILITGGVFYLTKGSIPLPKVQTP